MVSGPRAVGPGVWMDDEYAARTEAGRGPDQPIAAAVRDR